MTTISWLAVNVAFGALCGLYVSVVGFALSALLLLGAGWIFSMMFGAPIGGQGLLMSYVALQGGYFLSLLAQSLARHVSLLRTTTRNDDRNRIDAKFPREGDREESSF